MGAPLVVKDFDLGGDGLEAFYTAAVAGVRALAIAPDADTERRRMWEMVGYGLALQEYPGRFFGFRPRLLYDADPRALDALRLVLWSMAPEWVAAVDEAHEFSDDLRVVAAFAGVPPEVALALHDPSRAA